MPVQPIIESLSKLPSDIELAVSDLNMANIRNDKFPLKLLMITHYPKLNWNAWKAQWKHSYLTFLFAGKSLVLLKNDKYIDSMSGNLSGHMSDQIWPNLG